MGRYRWVRAGVSEGGSVVGIYVNSRVIHISGCMMVLRVNASGALLCMVVPLVPPVWWSAD